MIKREAFSVNAERLKEIMAKETSADGTPKKSRIEEDTPVSYTHLTLPTTSRV